MTLYQIISTLKQIALTQPNVKSATDGSVYEVMNANPSVKYNVVHFSQTTHQSDEEFDYYGLNIFYISRLEDSLEDNRLQVQSIGKEILDNIIRTFCENWNIEFPTITFYPFTQKFADLCAGFYCNVRIEVPKEIVCADDFIGEVIPSGKNIRLQDVSITITQNGLRVITPAAGYDGIGEITISTEVPQTAAVLEDKEYDVTENGEYIIRPSSGFDGMTSVVLSVDVPQSSGGTYEEGYEDGVADQKAKLVATSFTQNSAYTREDGWSAVTVNVPDRYNEGYESGYGDGEEAQKAKLVQTSVTENGIYYREDGYSAVEVNVPVSADLIANLQGDYYVIPYGTTHLRGYAFFYTCFSSITIPTTVSAIGDGAFSACLCLQEITIPDTVTSIGVGCLSSDSALTSVTLSKRITTIPAQCFYYSNALPNITIPGSVTNIGANAFEGCSSLTAMTFEGLVPPTLASTVNSLGSSAYTFPIYVPCVSVDAYKAAFGYRYAPRIQCIDTDLATAITFNVPATIYGSATTTVSVEPSGAVTSIYYTSSDNTLATIDSNGNITVLASGTVTFCAIDARSGLEDCKTVNVYVNDPLTLDFVYLTTGNNQTITLFRGIAQDSSATFYNFYNAITSVVIDGVTVPKSTDNIKCNSVPSNLCWYEYTFEDAGTHNVKYYLSSAVTALGSLLFSSQNDENQLVSANIMSGITEIKGGAFQSQENLTSVTLSNSVTSLKDFAFQYSGIESIIIPDSVTGITNEIPGLSGYGVFDHCASLTSVTIGTGCSEIGQYTFQASGLQNLTVKRTTPPTLGSNAFYQVASLAHIYVPAESVEAYKAASGWSKYANIITAIQS